MRPWDGVEKGPLTRFFLINLRWVGVYLHRINRPDADRECHDHPWSFVSLVVRGWYIEERRDRSGRRRNVERPRFGLAYRHATDAHRIVACAPVTWTLVIRGRDRETWGFYEEHGAGWARWIPWHRFVTRREIA